MAAGDSDVTGWAKDAIHELQTLVEKAKGGDESEAKEHIEEAQRQLEFAMEAAEVADD